ncbi:unnamed protein product [Rhizophagus irregularis]|nr:unnamed protein product [Rhizophagus irregularis]
MTMNLKGFNTPENILEFANKFKREYKFYGITQNPETKNYMMVLNNICEKCDEICNSIHFQHKFIEWTNGNDDINKFIQNAQLSTHGNAKEALEWIPYDRLYDIRYITKDEVYRANWIDGYINYWDKINQNWIRCGNKDVILKSLNNLKNITMEFTNEINKTCGITQNPETKNYMMVLICKKCNYACYAIQFQHKFKDWTSGNDDIDKFIQDTQLLAHNNTDKVIEWIPYDKFNDIKYIAERQVYKANWIDGNTSNWDNKNQNWKREDHNMTVNLKRLNAPENILEFANKIKREYKFFGITQDPETKIYLFVLSNICEICNFTCIAAHFQRNFKNWTSGNHDIDKFIQNTQLSVHSDYEVSKAVEWISYDRFYDIKYIAKGGFGEIYRATWLDGYICLNNSKNVALEFMNEITLHYKVNDLLNSVIKFYGITQDPKTKNYIMVMNFAENGSLRKFLDESYRKLNWYDKINCLWIIAYGLNLFHKNELIHRDFHIGNILYKSQTRIYISDMGLCRPANYNTSEISKNSIYGNLPYMAPEILQRQNYTKAADIYSFGIIMYEVISGLPPYYNIGHDGNLAIRICQGLRPRFNIKVPQLIVHLIKRCLDANPLNRPTANEIYKILREWYDKRSDSQTIELQRQIEESEKANNNLSISNIPSTSLGLSYKIHSGATYSSRLLNYNNLPEPKNSDDYYEQNDNIISMEFSESLQIDISQLKIGDNVKGKNYSEYSEFDLQINIIKDD